MDKGQKAVRTQFHGISSLGLVLAAITLAAVGIFQISWVVGVVYLVSCAVASLTILYVYCAKCPCPMHCGHVFPGKIVLYFKSRTPGTYKNAELIVTGLALTLLIGFPQAWLWQHPGLLIAFWLMVAIAVIQIRTVVCRICDNIYCPAKSR